jgi:B-box zinc finger
VRAFPALLTADATPRPEAALEGEAVCFDHPGKRATSACSQCGRYLCGLCTVEFGAEVWCPSCVATRAGRAQAANLETSRALFDSVTLTLPLASLAVWPVTFLAAPAALAIGIAKWNHPLSLVRRSRWRIVLGILLALAEIVGWAWVIAYLLTRPPVRGA